MAGRLPDTRRIRVVTARRREFGDLDGERESLKTTDGERESLETKDGDREIFFLIFLDVDALWSVQTSGPYDTKQCLLRAEP